MREIKVMMKQAEKVRDNWHKRLTQHLEPFNMQPDAKIGKTRQKMLQKLRQAGIDPAYLSAINDLIRYETEAAYIEGIEAADKSVKKALRSLADS